MHYFLILFLLGWHLIAEANVKESFEKIKQDPNALYAFLKQMPKGGELHYHLAGGAYPEYMLDLAIQKNYCINSTNYTVSISPEKCLGLEGRKLLSQPKMYTRIIQAWSMKNFVPSDESGHDHFFNTFQKFMPIVNTDSTALLEDVMKRAADQNEIYLELMLQPDKGNSASFGRKFSGNEDWSSLGKKLLADSAFQKNVNHTIQESLRLLETAKKNLGCRNNPHQKTCRLTVAFQYYVLREQPIEQVFAQALHAFVAASRSPHIVGVNLVQPEDGIISLRDYHKQMQIFSFLRQQYPQVHLSLHAGELAPDLVSPENLRFHITEAVELAKAERIGHGTSIAYENNAEALVDKMATKGIAVEINLTSNEKILRCKNHCHPLHYYLAHHVPVVLSTDDEGVLRTHLTHELVKAVMQHHLDYTTLKEFNRNTLTYSFLPGKSLWSDSITGSTGRRISQCENMHSSRCFQFLKDNLKAKLQWRLEEDLTQFEKTFDQTN